jgi:hypothetical protein
MTLHNPKRPGEVFRRIGKGARDGFILCEVCLVGVWQGEAWVSQDYFRLSRRGAL